MPSAVSKLKALLKIAKSVDDGALKDIEQIDDITDDNERIPEAREVGTSRELLSARGGAAEPSVARNSDLAPQTGVTEQYIRFNARLARNEKAMKALTDAVKSLIGDIKKAGEEAEKEEREAAEKAAAAAVAAPAATKKAGDAERDKDGEANTAPSDKENMEKCHRAARLLSIAITKAEDVEDAEDVEENLGKAEKLLATLKAAVEKAEEDAKDEDEEKRAEKARQRFRDLRKSFKDAKAAVEAKKAAASKGAAPPKEQPTAPSPDVTKALDTLAGAIGMQSLTMQEFMERVASGGRAGVGIPPTFAKSAAATAPESLDTSIEGAFESGLIDSAGLMKARTIQTHLVAAKAGRVDLTVVQDEIERAPEHIKRLFLESQPAQAAA